MLALTAVTVAGCWDTKRNPRYCDGAALRCETPALPYCDLVHHECVSNPDGFVSEDMTGLDAAPKCTGNDGCQEPGKPICDATSGACRACAAVSASADCAGFAGRPVCATTGACVECGAATDCAAAGKTCDTATNTCVACKANSECTSDACRADGSCALATDIVHVDNKNGACVGGAHAGTAADPFCQVAEAFGATQSTIVVAGSGTDYNAIVMTTGLDKAIVGPGRDAAAVARFAQPTKSGVLVNPAAGTAKLSLAGVVLVGSSGGTDAPGVACTQSPGTTAVLSLARSTIMSSGGVALKASDCNITLDADDIHNNGLGGVSISGGTYSITNNLIALNGNVGTATVPGVKLDANATGTFAFNTIAKNFVSAGVGGIDCSAAPHAITGSIVVQTTAVAGSQFAGACTFTDVVAGTTETAANTTKLDPAFVSPANLRLDGAAGPAKTANDACCIDKVGTATNDHDVDQNHRPRGTSWDIGAFEAP